MQLYQRDSYCRSVITAITAVDIRKKRTAIAFEDQLFHPAGGGQPSDSGEVSINACSFPVVRLIKESGTVWTVLDSRIPLHDTLKLGQEARCTLDWDRRYRSMRYHTASHVLMAGVRRVFDSFVPKGIEISDDHSRCVIRFSSDELNPSQKFEEAITFSRSAIDSDLEVVSELCGSVEEAKDKFNKLFRVDPTLSFRGAVRILLIKGLDANPCGGTHLKSTREIGELILNDVQSGSASFLLSP